MYVGRYVCTYVCMYIRMYECIYVGICTHTHIWEVNCKINSSYPTSKPQGIPEAEGLDTVAKSSLEVPLLCVEAAWLSDLHWRLMESYCLHCSHTATVLHYTFKTTMMIL